MRRRGSEQDDEATTWETPETPTMPSHPVKGELTVIGGGARLEGNLISAASLRIEGSVKGQITAEGDVIVATGAEVSADIRATNVTLGGSYQGNVTVSGTLELEAGAKVEGNLSCQELIVNRGAIFTGQSIMGRDSTPAAVRDEAASAAEES